MSKLLPKVYLVFTSFLLLNCNKSSVEKDVISLCSSSNFGVKVNNGSILCAKGAEILPNIQTSGELEMYYTFNNCCSAIWFKTINFTKSGTSDLVILRFGTPDEKISFGNNGSKIANGKITINKIDKNILSASFSASFKDDNGKNVNIEGNFKDIVVDNL